MKRGWSGFIWIQMVCLIIPLLFLVNAGYGAGESVYEVKITKLSPFREWDWNDWQSTLRWDGEISQHGIRKGTGKIELKDKVDNFQGVLHMIVNVDAKEDSGGPTAWILDWLGPYLGLNDFLVKTRLKLSKLGSYMEDSGKQSYFILKQGTDKLGPEQHGPELKVIFYKDGMVCGEGFRPMEVDDEWHTWAFYCKISLGKVVVEKDGKPLMAFNLTSQGEDCIPFLRLVGNSAYPGEIFMDYLNIYRAELEFIEK